MTEPARVSVLTFKRNLRVPVQVLLQLVTVHFLRGGEGRSDGRVDAAEVQLGGGRRAVTSPPRGPVAATGAQVSPDAGAQHRGTDGLDSAQPLQRPSIINPVA